MEPGEFHEYLNEEGLANIIEARTKSGEAHKSAREKYGQYAKVLLGFSALSVSLGAWIAHLTNNSEKLQWFGNARLISICFMPCRAFRESSLVQNNPAFNRLNYDY